MPLGAGSLKYSKSTYQVLFSPLFILGDDLLCNTFNLFLYRVLLLSRFRMFPERSRLRIKVSLSEPEGFFPMCDNHSG